jgi:Putative 2OG-Fe(II) oxygenase
MTSSKPQVKSLFATPMCMHFVPIAHDVNTGLRPLILARTQDEAAAGRGQGTYVREEFSEWGNHHANSLFMVVSDLADSLTASRGGGRVKTEWKISTRVCARARGEYQKMTARPGSFWSGLYFVDDGYANSDDENLGGQVEFGDPRGSLPAMAAPHLSFRMPGGQNAGYSEIVRPQTGMILLHPAWLPRGERRYDGDGQRLTIEFDLAVP